MGRRSVGSHIAYTRIKSNKDLLVRLHGRIHYLALKTL
jgi:hypothetical protein